MKILVLGFIISLLPATTWSYPLTPDPEVTPSELCTTSDPHFERYRYDEAIPYCQRKVSSSQKRRIYGIYGIPNECRNRYTIDHLIPLSLGGNNSDENLWPEHKLVKATRPNLELELFYALENGELTQDEVVTIIVDEKFEYAKKMAILASKSGDHCNSPGSYR